MHASQSCNSPQGRGYRPIGFLSPMHRKDSGGNSGNYNLSSVSTKDVSPTTKDRGRIAMLNTKYNM